jgi:hypothetical protein
MQGLCNQFYFSPHYLKFHPPKNGWPNPQFFEVIQYFIKKCQLAVVGMAFV